MQNKLTNLALKCMDIYKDYETTLNNISEELGLQNKVASLSNCAVADALTYTIRNIAYAGREPNHETICKYLKQAIEDLASGMDAADVLWKYDNILCILRKPEHRGYRAKFLIVDDLCDIDDVDKEELKETIKNAEQKVIDFCGCNLKT